MIAQLYLITKVGADTPAHPNVNDIHACIINSDDAGTDAVKIAELEAKVITAGHPIKAGYFDTVQLLGPPTAGIMTTDEDVIILLRRTKTEIIT